MTEIYRKLFALLNRRARLRFVLLTIILVAVSLSELISISAVLLLFGVLSDPVQLEATAWLIELRAMLGFEEIFRFQMVVSGMVIMLVALGLAVKAGGLYATMRFSASCGAAIACQMLGSYLRFPYAWFLNRNTAEMTANVIGETGRVTNQVLLPAMQLLGNLLLAVVIIGFLLSVDTLVALVAAATVGGSYLWIFKALRSRLQWVGHQIMLANRTRFRIANEAAGGLKELKLLSLEETYVRRFAEPSWQMARYQAQQQAMSQLPRFALEGVAFAAMIGVLLVLMLRHDGDLMGAIPVLGTFAFAAMRLLPALQQIYFAFASLRAGRPALDALYSDYTAAMAQLAKQPLPAPSNARLSLQQMLEIKNLHYSYPGATRAALRGVSLQIPACATVGFVGGTGAGKTTLVDAMLGLLTPDSGTIRVDGQTLNRTTMRSWQQNIGYVPQAIFLTDATVAENIAFGLPYDQVDMARVERAARIAALHDFVTEELPESYATLVGERGVRLSGGQRQRIGIARALYHDPTMLIFDEATSALDTLTEKAVMEAVQRIRHDKTVVLIAHRLTTVRHCDRIYLLEQGQIAASGRYEELVESNETFRKMTAVD